MVDSSQLTQGGSKVRRPCQSTIVGLACAELRHSDRNLRTAWFEKGGFKIGILKNHWVDFYNYRADVYTLPTHVQTTCKVNFASDDPFNESRTYSPTSVDSWKNNLISRFVKWIQNIQRDQCSPIHEQKTLMKLLFKKTHHYCLKQSNGCFTEWTCSVSQSEHIWIVVLAHD